MPIKVLENFLVATKLLLSPNAESRVETSQCLLVQAHVDIQKAEPLRCLDLGKSK